MPIFSLLIFLPLILLLPRMMGIDGILYAGPTADLLSAVCAVVMAMMAFRDMRKLEANA